MSERSYDDWTSEFKELNFFKTMLHLSAMLAPSTPTELMALRSRFLHLAYLERNTAEDEKTSAINIAETIEEIIVFKLRTDLERLNTYMEARNLEFDRIKLFRIGSPFDQIRYEKSVSDESAAAIE